MIPIAFSLVAIVIAVASYVGYRALWDRRDINEFTTTLERLERVVDRIESATFVVAADLASARKTADMVASDLANSQHRADGIVNGQPGEAADAGAQSG